MRKPTRLGARLRIAIEPGVALGPGKADLLEAIAETGSISAAGRRLKMSYRRAWLLVDEMNNDFATPLVQAAKGGSHGGGAALTGTGEEVLGRYRNMERLCNETVDPDLRALRDLVRRPPAKP
jgi:molybdate transport system regulatory protein